VLFNGSFFTPKSRSKNKKLIVCFTEKPKLGHHPPVSGWPRSVMSGNKQTKLAKLAFRFVFPIGIVNLFADFTYEGARFSPSKR
jgi:hypothetical protein